MFIFIWQYKARCNFLRGILNVKLTNITKINNDRNFSFCWFGGNLTASKRAFLKNLHRSYPTSSNQKAFVLTFCGFFLLFFHIFLKNFFQSALFQTFFFLFFFLHDQMVAGLIPSQSSWRILFSKVNFECWLLFSVCSIPVLSKRHGKDPGHSAKSAGAGYT